MLKFCDSTFIIFYFRLFVRQNKTFEDRNCHNLLKLYRHTFLLDGRIIGRTINNNFLQPYLGHITTFFSVLMESGGKGRNQRKKSLILHNIIIILSTAKLRPFFPDNHERVAEFSLFRLVNANPLLIY